MQPRATPFPAFFATGASLAILGVAAGALFGVSDVALKYLTDAVQDGVLELLSPWSVGRWRPLWSPSMPRPAACSSARVSRSSRSPRSRANLTAIIGGILVFRDPVGTGGVEITGRMAAFCLVIVGAALIPAPMRATREPSH